MATTSGRFTFPVSTYYAKSRSFKQRIENFAEEIDSTLFQVIKTNMSSMHPQDQTVINKACKPGQKELTKLKTKYIPKWHSMQNENGNNPMIGVVEFDQKYQKSFDGLKSGK